MKIVLLFLLISVDYLYCQSCNAGEFKNSNSSCQLCTSVTTNCLSCSDGNGTCEICKGFIPAINGSCFCNNDQFIIFNSTDQTYSCASAQVAQSYWTNYSTQISQMTENLTIQDYYILQAAAYGVNGGASYVCPALQAIGTVLDYGIAEMYTQEKQLHALAAAGVLVALAYNQAICFDAIYSSVMSANNLARFNYTTLKIMSLLGGNTIFNQFVIEFHGIIIKKINQIDFSGLDIREARFIVTQAEISLDNWKNKMLDYVADAGYLKTYHFSNIYIKFGGVTGNSFSSGLLNNNYNVWVSSNALAKFPANQSIYFVQAVYTSNPLGYPQLTSNVVSNIESLQFFYSSSYTLGNSYLTGLKSGDIQFMFNLGDETPKVVFDQWNANSIKWIMNSNDCTWINKTVACNAASLATSNIYALVQNQGQEQ